MSTATRGGFAAFLAPLLVLALSVCGHAEDLPETMPPPAAKPQADELPETMPSPAAKPQADELPETMPSPAPKPQEKPAATTPSPTAEDTAAPLPDDEAQCRERLKALGAIFTEAAAINEPEGCSASHPITVSRLSAGVALEPPAVLTCAMAEASARFVRDHAAPLAREEFGSPLATVEQASSYVCRPRRGTPSTPSPTRSTGARSCWPTARGSRCAPTTPQRSRAPLP
jgi:hypothetical protein